MKYRFHWGWAIGIFYTLFILLMIYFVLYSKTVDHSLERDNYYDYDIGYEKLIGEKMRNSNSLVTKLRIEYNAANTEVLVHFPKDMSGISGEIWFYRNNNRKLDTKIPVKTGPDQTQRIDVSNFPKGRWRVSVDWKSGGKNYLNVNEFYFN